MIKLVKNITRKIKSWQLKSPINRVETESYVRDMDWVFTIPLESQVNLNLIKRKLLLNPMVVGSNPISVSLQTNQSDQQVLKIHVSVIGRFGDELKRELNQWINQNVTKKS